MSDFFFEDLCIFKADPAIIGTIERTWSDIDCPSKFPGKCYLHKDLPLKVRKAWFDDQKLTSGYVILAFKEDYDGSCLVAERCLQLVDRSLAVGDVVKKRFSDTLSGTVISTSIICSLQPLCSEKDYSRQYPSVLGHTPSHGPHAPKSSKDKGTVSGPKLVHGFPASTNPEPSELDSLKTSNRHLLQAPASELKFGNKYRKEDTLIYKGWVGEVRDVYDEVTVRLGNGSVVVVENPEELEEPYWVAGTPSYELAQRLDRAGYYQYSSKKQAPGVGKPQSTPAEPCYPGQYVQTKKGNLRCGKWKFGAYDPTIAPKGIVVDVRNVQLEVRWLFPTKSQQATPDPPSPLLDTEELENGGIVVYDRSRVPKQPVSRTLPNASYSRDTGFGHRVRFRDPFAAAVKYGPNFPGATPILTSIFDRVPRTATQGFDMNVLEVVATASKAMVRWQDCSSSEEDSVQLLYYMSPDHHDAWPGEKVSFIPDEEKLGEDVPIIRLHKVGVAQSVNAGERIAHVRWFEGTEIDVDEEKALKFSESRYGRLRDEVAEVPIYDIASHVALGSIRGDLVTITPEQIQPPGPVDTELVGEIIDLCLDGQVLVRLGAASEVREIKIPVEQVNVIASAKIGNPGYSDGSDEEEDLYFSDAMSVSDEDIDYEMNRGSVRAVDVSVEYEGGEKLNEDDDDEEMWATDDEDIDKFDTQKSTENDFQQHQHLDPVHTEIVQLDGGMALEPPNMISSTHTPITYSSYSSKPPSFSVLDSGAPSDHHFIRSSRPLTANLMRRVMKEHKIMQSSLPDGIFVRTWESRLDLLRVLIIGPFDTPYEFAPFVLDFHFGLSFPTASPDVYFHSWTGNAGRINPNLYEDGKVCLSLLGTWDADERNEEWSSKKSTVLQILVSLMGLVLVKEPYFSKNLTLNPSQPPLGDGLSPYRKGGFYCSLSTV